MIDLERCDALAAAFSALGKFHRRAPDEVELAVFRSLVSQWPVLDTVEARAGSARMHESAELGESAALIERDHDRLYGVSATAAVPPYESVHRGLDRLVFDRQTREVREVYRSVGLQAPNLNREPDDHIGLEFDFLAHTLVMILDMADDHRDPSPILEIACRFFHDHVMSWAPAMLAEVELKAASAFMAGLALMSIGTLRSAEGVFGPCAQAVRTAQVE